MTNKAWAITILIWVVVLSIGWLAYAPALGGVFLLDDFPNLSGLATIRERGALEFILSQLIVFELTTAGDFDGAREYLREARGAAPLNPMHRYLWMRQLKGLDGYVERLASTGTDSAVGGE